MKCTNMEGEERFGPVTSWLYANLCNLFHGPLMYDFVVNDIMKSRAHSILDVGTGPGEVPVELASRSGKFKIYAIDPSKYMLRMARKRAYGMGIRFAQGYSQHVPFDTKFDMIISSISFHHWAHKKESLRYLSGFLSKKGEIRIYEFKKVRHLIVQEHHSMTRDELADAAKGTGLRLKGIVETGGKLRASYCRA